MRKYVTNIRKQRIAQRVK